MKKILLSFAALLLFVGSAVSQEYIKSQWEGKKVAFLGDSITDKRQIAKTNDVYWNFLKDILGFTPYVYGISGHQMYQIIGQAQKLEQEHGQDVDAIFVFVGTNDYNAGVPIGEWYKYSTKITTVDGPTEVARVHRELIFDDSTFKGRTNNALRYLKSHYPDKQIVLMTPIHRGYAKFSEGNIQPDEAWANEHGHFIDDYVQAVKEAGNVWAVPVIDLNSISGLYPVMDEHAAYFRKADTDRLHPNTPGHLRMAYAILYQMLALPASFEPITK